MSMEERLEAHFRRDTYSGFQLTNGIRPGMDLEAIPKEGYRINRTDDEGRPLPFPTLTINVTRANLFEVFMALLAPVGKVVDVILETSHDNDNGDHRDLLRGGIDLPVLQSHLYDFEDLLLNCGCSGIAVINERRQIEVQFDEHKFLSVFAEKSLLPFRKILRAFGIRRKREMKVISEGEHFHYTEDRFVDQFEQLSYRVGAREMRRAKF